MNVNIRASYIIDLSEPDDARPMKAVELPTLGQT
jgi:hypothetical protein